jgi:simple sugar transport system ATP-binding protein
VPSRQGATLGEVVLTTTGLTVEDSGHRLVDSVSLELRCGEILGIAGVDGNGQLELLESIAGLRRSTSGSVVLNGVSLDGASYARRSRLGLQLVSGDRRRDGIVPTFTIAEHFQYMLGRSSLKGLKEVLQQFDVRPPSPLAIADELSGGNQQKMVMARALKRPTDVLLVSYPTQGLDVMATAQLQQILLRRADLGTAVIVLSSDLDELLQICNSIAVMNGGAVIGTQHADRFDRDELAAWYTSRSATAGASTSPGSVTG